MICNPEDIVKILEAIDKRGFTETQVLALEEIIRRIIAKMDCEGFWNHDHENGEQINFVAERCEETAYKR